MRLSEMQEEEQLLRTLAVIVPPKNLYFDNLDVVRRLSSKKDD